MTGKWNKTKCMTPILHVFFYLPHALYDVSGASTALRMCYMGYGHPLTLFLEEGGVVTVCKINTQEPEEPIDFEFSSSNVTNKVQSCFCSSKNSISWLVIEYIWVNFCFCLFSKVILQSESLKEAFSELDMTSEVLQITMSPSQPYFRWAVWSFYSVLWFMIVQ